jgi:hypothetical protein
MSELAQVRGAGRKACLNDPDPAECWKLQGASIVKLEEEIAKVSEQILQCQRIIGLWVSRVDDENGFGNSQYSEINIMSWDPSNLDLGLTIRKSSVENVPVQGARYDPYHAFAVTMSHLEITLGQVLGRGTGGYQGSLTSVVPTPVIVGHYIGAPGPIQPWTAWKPLLAPSPPALTQ